LSFDSMAKKSLKEQQDELARMEAREAKIRGRALEKVSAPTSIDQFLSPPRQQQTPRDRNRTGADKDGEHRRRMEVKGYSSPRSGSQSPRVPPLNMNAMGNNSAKDGGMATEKMRNRIAELEAQVSRLEKESKESASRHSSRSPEPENLERERELTAARGRAADAVADASASKEHYRQVVQNSLARAEELKNEIAQVRKQAREDMSSTKAQLGEAHKENQRLLQELQQIRCEHNASTPRSARKYTQDEHEKLLRQALYSYALQLREGLTRVSS